MIEYTLTHDLIVFSKGWYRKFCEDNKYVLTLEEIFWCVTDEYFIRQKYTDERMLYVVMSVAKKFDCIDIYEILYRDMEEYKINNFRSNNWFTINTWRTHLSSRLLSHISCFKNDLWIDYKVCDVNMETLNPNIINRIKQLIESKEK